MQILSCHSGARWIATKPAQVALQEGDKEERDPAKEEIKRVLSDCFRCNNLVILTGLGTSLHVNAEESVNGRVPVGKKKIAPTMPDLWQKAEARSSANFDQIITLTKFQRTIRMSKTTLKLSSHIARLELTLMKTTTRLLYRSSLPKQKK
jgi:hypothetical protein